VNSRRLITAPRAKETVANLNHLVRAGEERRWHGEAEPLAVLRFTIVSYLVGTCVGKSAVGLQRDQFSSECIRLSASGREETVDAHIQIFRPSKSFETLPQPCKSRFNLRIIFGKAYQYADPTLALRRLCPDPRRPYRHRSPNAPNELPPPHVRLKVQAGS